MRSGLEIGRPEAVALQMNTAAMTPPRCEHTGLHKPECHCPSCIAALVATRGAMR